MDSFDFEPNLLGVWNDDVEEGVPETSREEGEGNENEGNTIVDNVGTDETGNASWGGNTIQWNAVGVNEFNLEHNLEQNLSTTMPNNGGNSKASSIHQNLRSDNTGASITQIPPAQTKTSTGVAAAISETTSIQDEDRSSTTRSSGSSSRTPNNTNQVSSLHPLAIQSAASCPPPSYSDTPHEVSGSVAQNSFQGGMATNLMQPPNNSADLYGVDLTQALERSNIGLVNASAASIPPNQGIPSAANPHLALLTNNFLLAATGPTNTVSQTTLNVESNQGTNSSIASSQLSKMIPPPPPKDGVVQNNTSATRQAPSVNNNATTTTTSLPPFYLFDAPVELRTNFMQNQRRLGLPIEHDPNSFYFGETVNGYHPQHLMKAGALTPQQAAGLLQVGADPTKAGVAASLHHRQHHRHHPNPPQMIDARHGNGRSRRSRSGQIKNEREQKRAQKITELIEQLRVQIEDDGWPVDGRSKFNTLSKCAEYVKHLVKMTSEKEEKLKQLQSDVEMKKRKVEEEKAMQESRSDPESVTSSLTSDTTGSRRSRNSSSREAQSTNENNEKKRKAVESDENNSGSSGSPDPNKKPRVEGEEAPNEDSSREGREAGSGTGSGSGSGSGSGRGASAQGTSTTKTISTVSDLTDSNQCSSSNNSGSAGGSGETKHERDEKGGSGDQPSSSSISSDAAVASEKSSRERHSGHKDVVFKTDKRARKRPPSEVTSLERNFELNYEEVFNKSNIPQIIASTSGKIISWNECFAKATGYRKSEIERLTIFSLVRPENLSNFFDILAVALRPDKNGEQSDSSNVENTTFVSQETVKEDVAIEKSEKTSYSEVSNSEKTDGELQSPPSRLLDYTAITVPCIDFPAMKTRNQGMSDTDSTIDPLTVTVTLMADKDPRKRCFHCVFTNCRGTNGALGTLSPELLASLFSMPLRRRKKNSSSRNKRTRTVEHRSAVEDNDKDTVSDYDEEKDTPSTQLPSTIGGPCEEKSNGSKKDEPQKQIAN